MTVAIYILSAMIIYSFSMWAYHTVQYHRKKNNGIYTSSSIDRHLMISESHMVITLCFFIIIIALGIIK